MKPHRPILRLQPIARNLAHALAAFACALPLLSPPLLAQTHKVAKSENVVRSVGVYEWTGDMAKPAASRLIPISLFIDGKFEDAAVYLARPVPMALLTGNVYEIDRAGVPLGALDLVFSKHLEASDTAVTSYDDGWFGYGKFVPPAPPKKTYASAKPARTAGIVSSDDDDDSRPHFSSRSAAPGSGGTAATTTPGSGTTTTSSTTPPDDPDRPTLHRSTPDTTASSTSSGTTPPDDPDRPTLRRRTAPPDAAGSSGRNTSDTSVAALNDDPNRPLLHRGKPTGEPTEVDFPKLSGLPGDTDLHQLVAVSDPADRPPHDFTLTWPDENEHQAILSKMQDLARAQLTAYEAANAAPPPTSPAPRTTQTHPAARPHHVAAKQSAPLPEPLLDEQLKGYSLSYGGAPTYVYSAHTGGLGPTLRFVTIVAQLDAQEEPQIAIKSVTDAAHLDRAPRMKLVDAVDAEASNRASLLFELRAQNSRQFALYRVIGARADQTFLTGSTE
jgi:hypothetical protein